MKGKGLIVLLTLLAVGYYGYRFLPERYNPLFTAIFATKLFATA